MRVYPDGRPRRTHGHQKSRARPRHRLLPQPRVGNNPRNGENTILGDGEVSGQLRRRRRQKSSILPFPLPWLTPPTPQLHPKRKVRWKTIKTSRKINLNGMMYLPRRRYHSASPSPTPLAMPRSRRWSDQRSRNPVVHADPPPLDPLPSLPRSCLPFCGWIPRHRP